MIDTAAPSSSLDRLEAFLREELARGDEKADAVVPILRHLLANDGTSVFSDAILASIRGMLDHLARQLLDWRGCADGDGSDAQPDPDQLVALTDALAGNPALLRHVHAQALEWQFTCRLEHRLGVDPVLSPLLQALVASPDEAVSALAMRLLASQTRWCQTQRRMQLALFELPGDLFHAALLCMRTVAWAEPESDARAARAEVRARAHYDEAATRLGLLARLVEGMGSGAVAALSISHAGAAFFLSALAIGSGQDRDMAVLSTDESQATRLALGLRAAGLRHQGVEEQFLALHPDVALPPDFDRIDADRAAAVLSVAGSRWG